MLPKDASVTVNEPSHFDNFIMKILFVKPLN